MGSRLVVIVVNAITTLNIFFFVHFLCAERTEMQVVHRGSDISPLGTYIQYSQFCGPCAAAASTLCRKRELVKGRDDPMCRLKGALLIAYSFIIGIVTQWQGSCSFKGGWAGLPFRGQQDYLP